MSRTETTQTTPRAARKAATPKTASESTLKAQAKPRTRKPVVDKAVPPIDQKVPTAEQSQFSKEVSQLIKDQTSISQRTTTYRISVQELKVANARLELERQEIILAQVEVDAKTAKLGIIAIFPCLVPVELAPETVAPKQ